MARELWIALIYVYPDWPWICFLSISLGTLMLARFSLQMFAHHFVNGNPLASTGPLHFVYFFFSCFGIQIVCFDEFGIDPMTQKKAKLAFLSFPFFLLWNPNCLFWWVQDWSNDPREGKNCIPLVYAVLLVMLAQPHCLFIKGMICLYLICC